MQRTTLIASMRWRCPREDELNRVIHWHLLLESLWLYSGEVDEIIKIYLPGWGRNSCLKGGRLGRGCRYLRFLHKAMQFRTPAHSHVVRMEVGGAAEIEPMHFFPRSGSWKGCLSVIPSHIKCICFSHSPTWKGLIFYNLSAWRRSLLKNFDEGQVLAELVQLASYLFPNSF